MSEKPLSIKEANTIVGGLSNPSKMPGYGWGTSAKRCSVGSKLRKVANSVCAGCYAMKGRYVFDNVQNALERRWEAVKDSRFVSAMSFLLNKRKVKHPFFRWDDSGDITEEIFSKIVDVARNTPDISHWLPTREYGVISDFVSAGGDIPSNLCIRLSAYMVNGPIPAAMAKRLGVQTSTVVTKGSAPENACPAPKQGNECLDCRACWDREVPNVPYFKH